MAEQQGKTRNDPQGEAEKSSEVDPATEYERGYDERYDEALAWIFDKWHQGGEEDRPPTCPRCKTDRWTIGDVVDIPLRAFPERVHSYFAVTCSNCGYTMFVDANVARIGGLEPPALVFPHDKGENDQS